MLMVICITLVNVLFAQETCNFKTEEDEVSVSLTCPSLKYNNIHSV